MVTFSPAVEKDLGKIKEIYDYYILNTTATFHSEPVTISELREFLFIGDPKYPSFCIKEDNRAVGYCFLTRYKNRQAYDRTAEISIYMQPEYTGRGMSFIALKFLGDAAKNAGTRVIIGTLCGENRASIRLREKCGYPRCAPLKNVGEKFGKVLDAVMYEKEI